MRLAIQNRYTITLDDDPTAKAMIEAATGMPTIAFSDPSELLAEATKHRPVAVFVDVHLSPTVSGIGFIPAFAKLWPEAPILVTTMDGTEDVLAEAFANGAVDFLVKPLRQKELLARLQIRIAEMQLRVNRRRVHLGDVVIDTVMQTLHGNDKEISISRSALALFQALIRQRGLVVTKEQLKAEGWGRAHVTDNALNRRVFEVREALNQVSRELEVKSVYGKGFCLATLTQAKEKKRA